MKTHPFLAGYLALASLPCGSLSPHAADLVVTTLANDGAGSLRAAVDTANAEPDADLITFDEAFSGQFITLSSQLLLSNQVAIDASGLADGITLRGSGTGASLVGGTRIFEIAENAVVELNHLTISGGYAFSAAATSEPAGYGGAIRVWAAGVTLTLNHCALTGNFARYLGGAICMGPFQSVLILNYSTVAHNTAESGAGIYLAPNADAIINNCTFAGNSASGEGGAIFGRCTLNNSSILNNFARVGGGINGSGVSATNCTIAGNFALVGGGMRITSSPKLTHCTVSGNSAYMSDGGLAFSFPSGAALLNSIVAGNTAPSNSNSRAFPVVSNSLTNGDPRLAPLGNYGGSTPTMPPLAGSPAIDAGDDSATNALATDQRGHPRLSGAHVDIGAVESQLATNAPVLKLTFTTSPETDFTVLATTNVALPEDQWNILGLATEDPPGQYQFRDIFAPDYPHRFYQVTSP